MYKNIAYFIAACLASIAIILVYKLGEFKFGKKLVTWKSYLFFVGTSILGVVGAGTILAFADIFLIPKVFSDYNISLLANFSSYVGYYMIVFFFFGAFSASEVVSTELHKPNVFGLVILMLLIDMVFAIPLGVFIAPYTFSFDLMFVVFVALSFYSLVAFFVSHAVTVGEWLTTSEVFGVESFVAVTSNIALLYAICMTVAIRVV